jgi:hypothetical protein
LSVISRQRADLVGQQFGRALREAGDDAQAAGVRHGSGQFGEADKVHAALDDGVLDAEHLGDLGLHGDGTADAGHQAQHPDAALKPGRVARQRHASAGNRQQAVHPIRLTGGHQRAQLPAQAVPADPHG